MCPRPGSRDLAQEKTLDKKAENTHGYRRHQQGYPKIFEKAQRSVTEISRQHEEEAWAMFRIPIMPKIKVRPEETKKSSIP